MWSVTLVIIFGLFLNPHFTFPFVGSLTVLEKSSLLLDVIGYNKDSKNFSVKIVSESIFRWERGESSCNVNTLG